MIHRDVLFKGNVGVFELHGPEVGTRCRIQFTLATPRFYGPGARRVALLCGILISRRMVGKGPLSEGGIRGGEDGFDCNVLCMVYGCMCYVLLRGYRFVGIGVGRSVFGVVFYV